MQFPNRVRMALQKSVLFSSSSGPWGGRMQYAPTTGYVRSFEIQMQFPNRIRVVFRKTTLFSSPSGSRGGAYAIRPYGWVRVILRNTDAIPQPGTCAPSKNCPVFVLFEPAVWAYSIRPYDRVHAILRNTDAILQPGTCEGSKNGSVYTTVGGVWWGVCNTPLQPDTCDSSKYRCHFLTGYVRPFKKLSRFRPLWGRLVGVFFCAPTDGYMRFFEIPMQFLNRARIALRKTVSFSSPSGAWGGAYSIRPYNRVRARVRNTDATPRPGTCDPTKYRRDLSIGGAGVFGRWGGGGYRLRGRWA